MMVRCADDQMGVWLGGEKNDVSQSTRQVRGWMMCGLGVLVGLMGSRMLRGVETKAVGSCVPRLPH